VVVVGQEEARDLKHDSVGTEHLLLGLLHEKGGLVAGVLASFDITVDGVRVRVARTRSSAEAVTSHPIPTSRHAKEALEQAIREALTLGDNYIGPEHVLLGLLRVRDGLGARIILDQGADEATIRSRLLTQRAETGIAGMPARSRTARTRAALKQRLAQLDALVTAWERRRELFEAVSKATDRTEARRRVVELLGVSDEHADRILYLRVSQMPKTEGARFHEERERIRRALRDLGESANSESG
jgi:ATP-dependent Clp protease ATP-binding subunit ClpC